MREGSYNQLRTERDGLIDPLYHSLTPDFMSPMSN
jgi:hypothetical protein